MSEPDNFLSRWSRRKLEGEQAAPASPAEPASVARDPSATEPDEKARTAPATKPDAQPVPTFDLASLPSLESITAATDVRPFLMPGVPAELCRAALRRAWSADPNIRDFVGLAENAWDFTASDAIEGFGDLPAGLDIKKMVAEVFGDASKEAAEQPQVSDGQVQPDAVVEKSAVHPPAGTEPVRIAHDAATISKAAEAAPDPAIVHRTSNIASQQEQTEDQAPTAKVSRSHGGALPK